eukprot:1199352-Alexandrium_andersonii.AAC.1
MGAAVALEVNLDSCACRGVDAGRWKVGCFLFLWAPLHRFRAYVRLAKRSATSEMLCARVA